LTRDRATLEVNVGARVEGEIHLTLLAGIKDAVATSARSAVGAAGGVGYVEIVSALVAELGCVSDAVTAIWQHANAIAAAIARSGADEATRLEISFPAAGLLLFGQNADLMKIIAFGSGRAVYPPGAVGGIGLEAACKEHQK